MASVLVWGTVGAIALLIGIAWTGLFTASALQPIAWGWRLLSLWGAAFLLVGIGFVLSWRPTPGPYREAVVYPFGGELQAWQVTVGFDWLAFGVLFAGAVLAAARLKSRWLWTVVLLSVTLIAFPHVVIGLAFALD